jgi:predicted acylesterase/phospholipase RssA
MYELGVLAALDEYFVDFDSTKFDLYVGTSAGAFVSWLIASGLTPSRVCRAVLDPEDKFLDVHRHDIFQVHPSQVLGIARDLASISLTHLMRGLRGDLALSEFIGDLADALPAGIFSLGHYERWLERLMARNHLPRLFRDIRAELYITANDLDSGHRAIFGQEPLAGVPIAKAICASSAIPVFFEPMRIGGRDYIDGASGKTGHVDIALRRGADLIFIVNPRVPIFNELDREGLPTALGSAPRLRDKGLVTVWEQSERMSAYTKLHQGIRRYRAEFPRSALLIIEPKAGDADMFLQNPMNFAARRRIVRYGYESAVRALEERRVEFEDALARHRIGCDASRLSAMAMGMR